jgi:hypothetical protein
MRSLILALLFTVSAGAQRYDGLIFFDHSTPSALLPFGP